MIQIKTAPQFINEKKYIIDIVFSEWLGINYSLVPQEGVYFYEIILENGKKLIIKDSFFKAQDESSGYLSGENIPHKLVFLDNQFTVENNIPLIYGDDDLIVVQNKIVCGIDIFASTFFMLTRWEECANKTRDKHGRFPAYASLAYKNNFLDRPVVNEYVEMLWNMLVKLGIKQKRKERNFEILLTHDVDSIQKYRSAFSGCKEIVGDFVKRLDPLTGFGNMKNKVLTHAGFRKDPFDTFDNLMDISERAGLKSHFFLMGKGLSKYDNKYDADGKKLRGIIRNIKSRGHNIGLHATYNAYNDKDQFCKEKAEIEKIAGLPVTTGRQHYLRFEVPTTWQVWEDNGMEWDSTLSYADKEGFRCGTCCEYSVFNFLTREKLKLKEKPLIVMDGSFVDYQKGVTQTEMELKIQALVGKCRKYKGTFAFLWHNSSFGTPRWKPFEGVYKNVVTCETGSTI